MGVPNLLSPAPGSDPMGLDWAHRPGLLTSWMQASPQECRRLGSNLPNGALVLASRFRNARATSTLTFCAHLRSSLPIKRYIYRWCGRNLFWFALPPGLLPNGVMFVEAQPDRVPAAIAVTTDVR